MFSCISHPDFCIIISFCSILNDHLFDNPNNLEHIKNFAIRERSGFGLELYLKETAAFDEEHLLNSTYLVKDKKSHDIVGFYFLSIILCLPYCLLF